MRFDHTISSQASLMNRRDAIGRLLLWSQVPALVVTQAARGDAPKEYDVDSLRDVPYYDGPDADRIKHKLDLFLPHGLTGYPVLFFVHGGAWRHGDKSWMGVYSAFGKFCARQGIGVVVTNYRLSPGVTHPEHVKDVARAFAWTYRNIARYHGAPEQMFVAGHSAGGHLAALLATDEKYLKAEGLTLDTIRGAIPMSGVYRIPDSSPFFTPAFSDNAKVRRDASPVTHVRTSLPPFLIIYAESDLPYCGKDTSEEFCKALVDSKCQAKSLEAKDRNHISLIVKVSTPDDPASLALREFIGDICKKKANGE